MNTKREQMIQRAAAMVQHLKNENADTRAIIEAIEIALANEIEGLRFEIVATMRQIKP